MIWWLRRVRRTTNTLIPSRSARAVSRDAAVGTGRDLSLQNHHDPQGIFQQPLTYRVRPRNPPPQVLLKIAMGRTHRSSPTEPLLLILTRRPSAMLGTGSSAVTKVRPDRGGRVKRRISPAGADFALRYAASPLLRVRRSGGLRWARRGIAPHQDFSTPPHLSGSTPHPSEITGSDARAFARICRRGNFASMGYAGEAARRPSVFGPVEEPPHEPGPTEPSARFPAFAVRVASGDSGMMVAPIGLFRNKEFR